MLARLKREGVFGRSGLDPATASQNEYKQTSVMTPNVMPRNSDRGLRVRFSADIRETDGGVTGDGRCGHEREFASTISHRFSSRSDSTRSAFAIRMAGSVPARKAKAITTGIIVSIEIGPKAIRVSPVRSHRIDSEGAAPLPILFSYLFLLGFCIALGMQISILSVQNSISQ